MGEMLQKLRRAIENSGKHTVIATVKAVNVAELTCDVIFEREEIVREGIPLRIFNDDGGLGVAFIPMVNSEVLVAFVGGEESRPQVVKVQQWDYFVMRRGGMEIVVSPDNSLSLKRESGFEFTITADDEFSMGNAPSHKLLHGDAFLPLYNAHKHLTPDGPSTPPIVQLVEDEVLSNIFTVE